MPEIELKFQVLASRRAAVLARLKRGTTRRVRLRAVYVDTPMGALGAAGIALRIRHEGDGWVQTLKGAGADLITRFEHDVPRQGAAAEPPAIDAELHRGSVVGDRLLAVLDAARRQAPAETLAPRFSTDVQRTVRVQRRPSARIEVVLDQGEIRAGDARDPLCELELELLGGSPEGLVEAARAWIDQGGLWLDTRSKAERGALLARGQRIAPPATADVPRLNARMAPEQAWRAALRVCVAQISRNASQIAAGEYGPDHVHQLRVGIRRLRSAERLFGRSAAGPSNQDAAQTLFQALGRSRDARLREGLLAQATAHAAQALDLPIVPMASSTPPLVEATARIRDPATQHWLLDLVAASIEPDADDSPTESADWPHALARRLDRWHRDAAADARRYRELDDAVRHRLRKRIKRLRYAIEFTGGLFDGRASKRYLKRLRALQERLGEITDLVTARAALADVRPLDAVTAYLLGWLDARRAVLVEAALPALERFAQAPRFWRRSAPAR